jgi:predicted DNA-binding transcriptional regulator YafY
LRYGGAADLLKLAVLLDGPGLTLDEIMQRFGVRRRTVERWIEALEHSGVFHLSWERMEDGRKRWRIERSPLARVIDFSADELTALDAAVRLLERGRLPERAELARRAVDKIATTRNPSARPRQDPDIEGLMAGEGFAMRAGPRPVIALETLQSIRTALLACHRLRLTYDARSGTSRPTVAPLGILYGNWHFLVALTGRDSREPRLFRLDRIQAIEDTGEKFSPEEFTAKGRFNLDEFARRSFGTFQEKPQDIELLFEPGAARDAGHFLFHPSQTTQEHADGSLRIRFRCGGLLELAWHLVTWSGAVKIVAPAALRRIFAEVLTDATTTAAEIGGSSDKDQPAKPGRASPRRRKGR